jgi:outer membrane protein
MKRTLLCIAAAIAVATPSLHAQRVATVDMNKIFSSYYKTKDAEAKINEARSTAKGELDERMESYKKNLEAINKLNEEIQKPELSKEAKDQKMKARDEKIGETKGLEREINEFRSTREKQLQEQAVRMRNGIVEEITKIVQDIVKTKGYEIVFDKSGSSLNGVPFLISSKDDLDFSQSVIDELNKNRPKDAPAAAPAKAADKDAKKTN